VSFGFRFLLVHPDGEPADATAYLTAIPSWNVGGEFLAGSEFVKVPDLDSIGSRHLKVRTTSHGSVESVVSIRPLRASSAPTTKMAVAR
jgi:hypothetical protein